MRAASLVSAAVIAVLAHNGSAAFAGQPMAPSDIKATFFNGQPFNAAASPSGTKFTMTFTPDGKMTRQPLAQSGKTNVGIWKLNAKGFCTSWEHAGSNCYRGRDGHYWPPPAQIRTRPTKASGSYLGCLTSKRSSGQG